MNTYQQLLTIELKHEYYGGSCENMTIQPVSATAESLQQMRIICKVNKKGIYIYTNESKTGGPSELARKWDTSLAPRNPAAIASVILTQGDLKQEDPASPNHYIVPFKTRSVAWKYYIISDTSDANGQFKLVGDKAALYSGPIEKILKNGQKALVFESGDNLFPLQEHDPTRLSLEGPSGEGKSGDTFLVPLPFASASSLQMEDQKMFAAMYVYI